jgi:hypothetical protein
MQTSKIKRQRGMSALGIVIGLALIGFLLTCVLKILPVYMDDMVVKDNLKALGETSQFATMSREQIVSKLKSGFDLNGVRGEPVKSIKIYRRGEGWLVNVDYEERISFMGNIDIVLSFENQLNADKPEDCCKKLIPDVKE